MSGRGKNEHVVGERPFVRVRFSDGVEKLGAVIARDEIADLALVKVHTTRDLPFMTIAEDDALEQGDTVYLCGHPFGIDDLKRAVRVSDPGDVVEVTVLRHGRTMAVSVELGEDHGDGLRLHVSNDGDNTRFETMLYNPTRRMWL